jgi:hypothetical protein
MDESGTMRGAMFWVRHRTKKEKKTARREQCALPVSAVSPQSFLDRSEGKMPKARE